MYLFGVDYSLLFILCTLTVQYLMLYKTLTEQGDCPCSCRQCEDLKKTYMTKR